MFFQENLNASLVKNSLDRILRSVDVKKTEKNKLSALKLNQLLIA